MAKVTDLGWAKPDDPIYTSGLTIGGKRFAPSTPTLQDDSGGTNTPSAVPSNEQEKPGVAKTPDKIDPKGRNVRVIPHRKWTEEDYAKHSEWSVGTFHRAPERKPPEKPEEEK